MMINNKGFTLIEMIGIVIILAAILLVVAPSLTKTLKNNNAKSDEIFLKNLRMASENYIIDHDLLNNSSLSKVNVKDLLDEDYIQEIPSSLDLENYVYYVYVNKQNGLYTYKLCDSNKSNCKDIGN